MQQQSSVCVIRVKSGKLRFDSLNYGWEVDMREVVMIWGYTTQDGPMIDDHCFVLLTKDGSEFECPVTAEGCNEMQRSIGQMTHSDISQKLAFTTDFDSRIIAPVWLEGQALYPFETVKQSLFRKLLTGGRVKRCLTSAAKSVLQPTS